MMSLPVFLLARLDEDEAVAKAVPASPWDDDFSVRFDSWESDHSDEDRAFVDRFDPARVLAEVEAKRAIVEVAASLHGRGGHPNDVADAHMQMTLRLLALPYADHPDYRPEWKP